MAGQDDQQRRDADGGAPGPAPKARWRKPLFKQVDFADTRFGSSGGDDGINSYSGGSK